MGESDRIPESRLLDGFRVLFFPQQVFTTVNTRLPAGIVFGAAFITTCFLVAGFVYFFRQMLQWWGAWTALTSVISFGVVFFLLILLNGAASWLLDAIYCRVVVVEGAVVEARFVGNFLCRLLGMPWCLLAAFLCAQAANAQTVGVWQILATGLLIRLTVSSGGQVST